MTIKILKQGQLPEEITYKFVCRACLTEFTAQRKDGKLHSDQRDGQWLEVKCPLCGYSCGSSTEYKESKLVYPPGVRTTIGPKFQDRPPNFSDDPTGYY